LWTPFGHQEFIPIRYLFAIESLRKLFYGQISALVNLFGGLWRGDIGRVVRRLLGAFVDAGDPGQSPCNWGKSTQTLFCISIKPYFRVTKSYRKSPTNNKERMVRAWVKISLDQCQKLKKLREETDNPLSEIIREAVSGFVKKKDFPVSTVASYLPKRTRDKYKSVSAYFPRSDWNLLAEISKNTRRCKTKLIRQAIDDHLGK